MDHFQTDTKITINIYTKRKGLTKQNVIVDNEETKLRALVYLDHNEVFLVHLDLCEKVASSCVVRVGQSGKVEIDLEKSSKQRWRILGNPREKHLWCGERKVSADN
mgnify:FL=1